MKRILKRIAIVLAAAVFITCFTASALAAGDAPVKEEVVYANLKADGSISGIYVVNIFNVATAGAITDYGQYSTVKNLTNTQELALSGGSITADLPAGNFYYQGTLDGADLPWIINISYYLDGVKFAPADLAGRSGHLQIALSTKANNKVDASFFKNYLLQISVSLDTDKCSNIIADGATLANAGKNKLITYTVMPGETANINISADISDFSMSGIEMSAVPFSMQIATPDTSEFTDDMTLLTDAVNDLYEGAEQLKYGAWELKSGAADLSSGSSGFKTGLDNLNSGSATLVAASSQINSGLSTICASLSGSSSSFSLGSLTGLPTALRDIVTGLGGISSGLTTLKSNFTSAYSGLDTAMSTIPGYSISTADLAPLYAEAVSPANQALIDQLYATYTAAMAANATYGMVEPVFAAIGSGIDTILGNIGTISGSLTTMADGLDAAITAGGIGTAVAALSSGLSTLLTNYGSFHTGLVSYTGGISTLASNYSALNTGISDLSDGTGDFYSGVRDYYNGTEELNTAVADVPEQIELQIDEWMDGYDMSDFEPVSFTSPRNNTEMVQFVLKTEKIEKAEEPQAPEPEEKETFWTRFADLFRR